MIKIATALFIVTLVVTPRGLAQCGGGCYFACDFLTISADVYVDTSNAYHGSGRVVCYNQFMNQFCGDFEASTRTIDTGTNLVLAEDSHTRDDSCTDIWNGSGGGIGTFGECFQQRTSADSPGYYANEVGSAQQPVTRRHRGTTYKFLPTSMEGSPSCAPKATLLG